MKKLLYALAAMALFVASCTKSSDSVSVTSILKTGRWKIKSATISVRLPNKLRDTTLDYFNYIPSCHVDDYLRFDSLLRGYVYGASTKCNFGEPDSTGFVWKLYNNEQNMDIYNGFYLIDSLWNYFDPPQLDTISVSPLVLDTVWPMKFNAYRSNTLNIYNGRVVNPTTTGFELFFAHKAVYADTTGGNQNHPIYRDDSLRYHIYFESL